MVNRYEVQLILSNVIIFFGALALTQSVAFSGVLCAINNLVIQIMIPATSEHAWVCLGHVYDIQYEIYTVDDTH